MEFNETRDLPSRLKDNGPNDENMIFCANCGFRYSKKIKKCPQCHKKHSKPLYHKWWFWVIVSIVTIAILSTNTDENDNGYENNTNNISSSQSELSKDEYVASCVTIDYKDLARNPNNYIGEKVTFKGKVIQVQESGSDIVLRVDVTQDEYGFWDDTIYVDYERKSDNENRILEDDIITLYGEVKGIKKYTAVLGNQISIPHIISEYVEIGDGE